MSGSTRVSSAWTWRWTFYHILQQIFQLRGRCWYSLPVILQGKGVSPVWVYSCCFSLPGLENVLKHSSQVWAVPTTLPATSSSLSYRSSEYSGDPRENWPKSSSCSALSEGLSIIVRRWGKFRCFFLCPFMVCHYRLRSVLVIGSFRVTAGGVVVVDWDVLQMTKGKDLSLHLTIWTAG